MQRLKCFVAGLLLSGIAGSAFAADVPKKPKLILAIVVDQFRYDYLVRFRADYTSGLKQLLDHGAVFDNAHLEHWPADTAIGHSTILSGATPSRSGIMGDAWYDRESGQVVTSVGDSSTRLVGDRKSAAGSSPRRLLVETLGDELKAKDPQARVVGVSIKDRAAILSTGHRADEAWWFDDASEHWVTSTYYMTELPGWVRDVNDARPERNFTAGQWFALDAKPGDPPFCSAVRTPHCPSFETTPWANEMIESFAERALSEEQLGRHKGTDLLAVSFSANDYVGHTFGPDAPQVRDISRRTDLLLGQLLEAVDRAVGRDNVMVALTADHGVAPIPEANPARRASGHLAQANIAKTVQDTLSDKYGPGKWIEASVEYFLYLNRSLMEKYKVSEADVDRTAADAIERMPHIFRVYTRDQIAAGHAGNDDAGRAMTNSYYAPRWGDLAVVPQPYYVFSQSGGEHGSPFDYDTHIPVIFMGSGIKAGRYPQKIVQNDIAPTLAKIAGVPAPAASTGRILEEIWR